MGSNILMTMYFTVFVVATDFSVARLVRSGQLKNHSYFSSSLVSVFEWFGKLGMFAARPGRAGVPEQFQLVARRGQKRIGFDWRAWILSSDFFVARRKAAGCRAN
jgi:hypothetical protein